MSLQSQPDAGAVEAYATLDWGSGLIIGFASGGADRPRLVDAQLNGVAVTSVIASEPFRRVANKLPPDRRPTIEQSAFLMRLPTRIGDEAEEGSEVALLTLSVGDEIFFEHGFANPATLKNFVEERSMEPLYELELTGLQRGLLQGDLIDLSGKSGAPDLVLYCDDAVVSKAAVLPTPGDQNRYLVEAPVSPEAFRDGVQVFMFKLEKTGEVLASYPVFAGGASAGSSAAELAALREEVALLKRAVRRQNADRFLPESEKPVIIAQTLRYVDGLLNMQRLHLEREIRAALKRGPEEEGPA